jgi:hypothetical protein
LSRFPHQACSKESEHDRVELLVNGDATWSRQNVPPAGGITRAPRKTARAHPAPCCACFIRSRSGMPNSSNHNYAPARGHPMLAMLRCNCGNFTIAGTTNLFPGGGGVATSLEIPHSCGKKRPSFRDGPSGPGPESKNLGQTIAFISSCSWIPGSRAKHSPRNDNPSAFPAPTLLEEFPRPVDRHGRGGRPAP